MMTYSELLTECRQRCPKGESFSIHSDFWHHDSNKYDLGVSETLEYKISRHGNSVMLGQWTAPTMDAVLEMAFPVLTVDEKALAMDVPYMAVTA